MSREEQAMSVEEVRENLDIRAGGPEEECPGCGRSYDHDTVDVHVPGRPGKTFGVYRCLYCGTLYEPTREGEAAPAYDLDKYRKIAESVRQTIFATDRVLGRVGEANDERGAFVVRWSRGELPVSPAAIDFMATAAGLSAVKAGCHGACSHSL